MKKILVGITGGSGAGKSVVSEEFKKAGIPVIDADLVAREVTSASSPALFEIAKSFGDEYIGENGELLRKKLGSLVFQNPDKLQKLNEIIKKYIEENINSKIGSCQSPVICLDAPLLIEYEMNERCDHVISVISEREKRIERIIKRDSLTKEDAKNRILSQPDDNFYIEKSDYILYNNGNSEALREEARKIISQLRENF